LQLAIISLFRAHTSLKEGFFAQFSSLVFAGISKVKGGNAELGI
jgi:hypothetical protein